MRLPLSVPGLTRAIRVSLPLRISRPARSILPLAMAAMAALALPGVARACTVDLTVTNPYGHPGRVFAMAQLPARPAWVPILPGSVNDVSSWSSIAPRSQRRFAVALPLRHCRDRVRVQVIVACLHSPPPHQFAGYRDDEHFPLGTGFAPARNMEAAILCNEWPNDPLSTPSRIIRRQTSD
jgi:hypothetical protein